MLRMLCLLMLSGSFLLCNAQLATYTFTNGPSDSPIVANLGFTSFTRVGLTTQTAAGAFNSAGFPTAAAIDPASYVEFAITAKSGYALTLTSISLKTQRSTQGPVTARVAYNSGGIFTKQFSPDFAPPTAIATTTWDFADTTVSNGGSVVFRIYGWASGGSGGTLRFDDVALFGSVTTASAGCTAPAGVSFSAITPTSCKINWPAVAGASAYGYALTNSITPPAIFTHITDTFYYPAALTRNSTYYFHLKTYCASDSSVLNTQSFITPDSATTTREIKMMTYNLLNYPGSTASIREPKYRTMVTSYNPDIMVVQEVSQPTGVATFLSNVLNFSTSTYSAGTFIDGPDSDNGIFYKTAKFQFISNTPVATQLRDINEFKLRVIESGDTIIIYSVHLKSSNTAPDEADRAAETDSLRKRTNALGAGKYFMVCGDFNIYGSAEQCYQNMIQNGTNANGKFNDIITMSGSWQSAGNAIHHTQSPRTTSFGGGATGGMDDRFDMILFSSAIVQPGGVDLKPNSYAAYGNDGLHYNQALNTPPFNMYPQAVMEAIHDGSDHIPVVVTLTYQGTLPVKLLSFNGAPKKDGVELRWATGSEHNSDYFMVQRSTDLASWTDAGTVKAAGTNSIGREYTFTDRTRLLYAGKGPVYYQLKQVDLDGRAEFFGPLAVYWNKQETIHAAVSPNPVDGSSVLNYDVAANSEVSITIYNISGTAINQLKNEYQLEGHYELALPALSPGVYYVMVKTGTDQEVVRIVKE